MSRPDYRPDDDDDPSGEDFSSDERPWTEEQWEKFMKESDARAARFGELLETLIDHPDRDVVVAREMGWNDFADALEEHKRQEAEGDEDKGGDKEASAGELPAGVADWDEEDDPVEAIPAYALATDVGEEVREALEPWMKGPPAPANAGRAEVERDERLGEAFIGIHIAAAKLAGGHGMGYEDEVLCGHIVNCRRALAGAEQSEEALKALADDGTLPREVVDRLVPRVREVEDAIKARIAELRARVWW